MDNTSDSIKVHVPPIKIQGIKTKLVPVIKSNIKISSNTTWVEPFMGSGVVGFNVSASTAVFSDINPHIIEFYNAIKDRRVTSSIVREYLSEQGRILSERDAEYYYEVRSRFNDDGDPLDFLFLNRACFNGMMRFNSDNKFNVPYCHKPNRFSKSYITKIVNQVKYVEDQLSCKDWKFVCQDYRETILRCDEDAFIYCDPPYIDIHVDYYDTWDERCEFSLRDALVSSKCRFMLSSWDHNQYRHNTYLESVWGFCKKLNVDHYYHVGAKEANRSKMVEAILMNYD